MQTAQWGIDDPFSQFVDTDDRRSSFNVVNQGAREASGGDHMKLDRLRNTPA